MSDKQKKFVPSAGYMVAVHQNALGIRAVAHELDIFPEVLAKALEKAGFQVVVDPFDLSADAGKLIMLQDQEKVKNLRLVKEGQADVTNSDPGAN